MSTLDPVELDELARRHLWLHFSRLGNYDAAFEWFERAYQARDFLMIWLHVGPMFRIVPPTKSRPITDDPRWTALVQRVGLAP